MIWQEFVFLFGSVFSILSLTPTLRSTVASVPWATSLPSAALGFVYGAAFVTLGMNVSAVGSLAAGVMWSLILVFRRPRASDTTPSGDPTGAGSHGTAWQRYATAASRWPHRVETPSRPGEAVRRRLCPDRLPHRLRSDGGLLGRLKWCPVE